VPTARTSVLFGAGRNVSALKCQSSSAHSRPQVGVAGRAVAGRRGGIGDGLRIGIINAGTGQSRQMAQKQQQQKSIHRAVPGPRGAARGIGIRVIHFGTSHPPGPPSTFFL